MKKRILCVDDIQTNLFIVQSVIEDIADDLYEVVLASSANEGLSILLKQHIDLVLMDIMMPDIDGLEATQMIKSNPKTRNIPVVFVTAKNDDETIEKCYKVGGDDYVSKPFNHVELLSRISFHIASREKDKLLLQEKEYVQSILDLQENLIFVSTKDEIITANKAFLNFYNQKNIKTFTNKFTCSSTTFVQEEDYFSLNKVPQNSVWIDEVIELSQYKDVLVKIIQDNEEYIFNVKATKSIDQYIVTYTDITQISQQALEYKHEASFDSLTQIYNRNMFHRLMDRKILLSKQEKKQFVFIFFDIDHFKNVNDTYGHLVGDDILINLVNLVKKHIRDKDIFARWGGEEFVLSFDVSIKKGLEIAENLREQIESYEFDEAGSITCSFGITQFLSDDNLDSLIKRADEALYEAKDSGRNKICQKM